MADPQVVICEQACTVTVQHEFVLPVLNLSPAEGAQIAGAILAVWAVAWGIRALIQSVRSSDGFSNESES